MNRSALRICIKYVAELIKSRTKPQSPVSVYEEMNRGSIIGVLACVLLAAFSGEVFIVLWAALSGAAIGAVISLLLWLASDNLDEQTIVPPHRPRWRIQGTCPDQSAAGDRYAGRGRKHGFGRARLNGHGR